MAKGRLSKDVLHNKMIDNLIDDLDEEMVEEEYEPEEIEEINYDNRKIGIDHYETYDEDEYGYN